jgi:hypothetical protein
MSIHHHNCAKPGAFRVLTAVAVGINLLVSFLVTLLGSAEVAYAGPCTAQIAQVEQKIRELQASSPPGGAGEPSLPQSVGAQLHHQPTARSVEGAESKANAEGAAALDRARRADAAGDANACANALQDAKDLYGID